MFLAVHTPSALKGLEPPCFDLPALAEIVELVKASIDSAPGQDGVPYSFWAAFPVVTAYLLRGMARSFLAAGESQLAQLEKLIGLLIFIPKEEGNAEAGQQRPLALPDTWVRLFSSLLLRILSKALTPRMCQRQAVISRFREASMRGNPYIG